jgi:hypothetical protein
MTDPLLPAVTPPTTEVPPPRPPRVRHRDHRGSATERHHANIVPDTSLDHELNLFGAGGQQHPVRHRELALIPAAQ